MSKVKEKLIARWETRGKKYWYELYQDEKGLYYKEDHGGGNLGKMTVKQATKYIEERTGDAKKYDGISYKKVCCELSK